MTQTILQKLPFVGATAIVLACVLSLTASAHVMVRPAEVVTAGFQTFTVGVPNERTVSTTSVRLALPKGLKHVSVNQKAGWDIDIDKDGDGESQHVTAITWSGGEINEGFRDDFAFSAQVPEQTTELQWKAYQTYADGTVVSWDQADEGGHGTSGGNAGPFSVTKVVSETEQQAAAKSAEQTASNAQSVANRALYIATAGLVVGLAGIFLATRKR